jgi:hypothetical protein
MTQSQQQPPAWSPDEEKMISLFQEALTRNDRRRDEEYAAAEAAKNAGSNDGKKDTTPKEDPLWTRIFKAVS